MEEGRKKRKTKKDLKMQKIAGLLFIALLAAFIGVNIVVPDRPFSESENRTLTQRPEMSTANIIDGEFRKDYESYKSDQFAFRQFFVSLKTGVSYMTGERESGGVFKGKDGYLLEEIKNPDKEALKDNLEAIRSFKEGYPAIPFYMMLVPNAAHVMKEKLPSLAVTLNQERQLKEIKEEIEDALTWVDAEKALRKHKGEAIYYRTDHHWTTLGAYYGFQAYADSAGLDVKAQEGRKPYVVTGRFNGALSSKSGYEQGYVEPIQIYYAEDEPEVVASYVEQQIKVPTWYDKEKLRGKDKYTVFLGGNYPLIDVRTTAATSDVLLVVKDSYANCFLPFLSPYYREIVVVDPRYYCGDIKKLMSDYQANHVLFLYNMNTFVEDNNISGVLTDE